MDAIAELGRNLISKHQIQPEYGDEQGVAGRDCRTRLARQVLRRERGQGKIPFPCSADHVQDWQPYPVHVTHVYNDQMDSVFSDPEIRQFGKKKLERLKRP